MPGKKLLVATCAGHAQAERAIAELQTRGLGMENLSIFGKAFASDEEAIGFYTAGGQLLACGGSVGFWERLWKLLGDGGVFFVPGVGAVAAAGPFVRRLVATIDRGMPAGGLSTLGAALCRIGVPKSSIFRCEIEMKPSEYVLVALVSSDRVPDATIALKQAGVSQITASDERRLEAANKVLQTV